MIGCTIGISHLYLKLEIFKNTSQEAFPGTQTQSDAIPNLAVKSETVKIFRAQSYQFNKVEQSFKRSISIYFLDPNFI